MWEPPPTFWDTQLDPSLVPSLELAGGGRQMPKLMLMPTPMPSSLEVSVLQIMLLLLQATLLEPLPLLPPWQLLSLLLLQQLAQLLSAMLLLLLPSAMLLPRFPLHLLLLLTTSP